MVTIMDTSIAVALISGILTLAGVLLSNVLTHQKMMSEIEKAQAVTDTKLEELTREVRRHNGFAEKIPQLDIRVKNLEENLK